MIKNKIQCNHCKDILESTYCHDFKWCSCRSCAIDGGTDYARRCGDGNWTNLTEYREATRKEKEQFIEGNIDEYLERLNDSEIDVIISQLQGEE